MKTKILLASVAALIAAGSFSTAQATTYTYVGSWEVGQGPSWGTDPLAYTGQEAAAALFGGTAAGYAISTVGPDPSQVNFDAWYSVLGYAGPNDGGISFAENYVSINSSQAPGYYYSGDSFTGTSTNAASAYVSDNAGYGNINYAFEISDVPEPTSMALLSAGLFGIGLIRRATSIAHAARLP